MRKFDAINEIDSLTDEEALEILQMSWDRLSDVAGHRAYGLDDHGDYLAAAVDNYHHLVWAYMACDGDPQALHDAVVKWLKSPEWGGSDGEIRLDLFTERWQEEEFQIGQAVHAYWVAAHPVETEQISTGHYLGDGKLLPEPETASTRLWEADSKAIEGKFWEEWPADVRGRVAEYMWRG